MDSILCTLFDSPTSFLQLFINLGWSILSLFGIPVFDLRGAVGDLLGCASY